MDRALRQATAKTRQAADPKWMAQYANAVGDGFKAAAKHIEAGNSAKAWKSMSLALGNLKTLVATLDGGTTEPKEVGLLSKLRDLMAKRK